MTVDPEDRADEVRLDKLGEALNERRAAGKTPKRKKTNPARTMLLAALLALVAVVALIALYKVKKPSISEELPTYIVGKGPLTISLQQTGTLEAIEYIPIASKLQRRLQIAMLVPEGETVEKGQVLVELDASQLEDEFDRADIELVDAQSDLFQAVTNYQVQLKQNETDLKKALLKAELARMELEKYLGGLRVDEFSPEDVEWARAEIAKEDSRLAKLAETTLEKVASGLAAASPVRASSGITPPGSGKSGEDDSSGDAPSTEDSSAAEPGDAPADAPASDTADAAADDAGGVVDEGVMAIINRSVHSAALAAEEKVREFLEQGGDMALRVKLCERRLEGYLAEYGNLERLDEMTDFDPDEPLTKIERRGEMELEIRKKLVQRNQAYKDFNDYRDLCHQGFITRQDRDLEDSRIKFISAELELENLLRYTIKKSLRQKLSDYDEAAAALEKTLITTSSERARKENAIDQGRKRYVSKEDRYNELKEWLTQTKLTAPTSGIVTYGDPKDPGRMWRRSQIAVGQYAYAGNVLMTIPDLSSLRLLCNVHEADISNIELGQTATVTPAGFPNLRLTGKVSRVASVANTGSPWLGTDVKEFNVEITLEGTAAQIKPGMSAKAEILVKELENVVHVPQPAIFSEDGENFCYVKKDSVFVKQPVIMGLACEAGVEIKAGLDGGEEVLLARPPIGAKIVDSDRKVTEPVVEVKAAPEKASDEAAAGDASTDEESEAAIPAETRRKLTALFKKMTAPQLSEEERQKVAEEMRELMSELTAEQQQQLREEMMKNAGARRREANGAIGSPGPVGPRPAGMRRSRPGGRRMRR